MRCPNCHRRLKLGASCPVDGGRAPKVIRPEVDPPDVPGHEVLSLIGSGGFGHVYSARRSIDGVRLAIKVGVEEARERFEREASALRTLPDGIAPRLFEKGRTSKGEPFLALELLDGESLAQLLASLPGAGFLFREQALHWFEDLCEVVSRMHEAGVIHRDLKPENIFIRRERGIALLDFGLARFAAETGPAVTEMLTRTGQRLGTTHYMAPEQCLEARQAQPASDIYSLGVILFELLTGRPPFVGEEAEIVHAHVSRRPPRPSAFVPVDPALEEAVMRCLAKSPPVRFPSARELRDAIRLIASGATQQDSSKQLPSSGAPLLSEVRNVALLFVRTGEPLPRIAAVVAEESGKLVSIKRGGYLFSFHQRRSVADGVRAAQRLCRKLILKLPATDLLVVHVAPLRISSSAKAVVGPALRALDDWWPANKDGGALMTREAATLLDGASTTSEQFVSLNDEGSGALETPHTPRLVGRDNVLLELRREAETAWVQGPSLTTLVGEVGYGKTRLLDTVAEELSQNGVQIILVRAMAADSVSPEEMLRLLLRKCFELPASHVVWDDVFRACAERLPRSLAEAASPAIALVLGALTEQDVRASRVLATPGAGRYLVAKAAGEAVRSLARTKKLALILDDAHRADPTLLDALEIATLAGEAVSLWICVGALPSLLAIRPFWGERAAGSTRHELQPLDGLASRELLRELLMPVEFVPELLLERLEAKAQGVPLSLVQLAQLLRVAGAIRPEAGSGAWYLSGDELLDSSPAPVHERLARHILDNLTQPLQALAQLCSIIGDELSVHEVDSAQLQLARGNDSDQFDLTADAGVGLDRLARARLLRPLGADRYAFGHPQLREAVEAMIPVQLRQRAHAAVLATLSSRSASARARVARHAAACGESSQAFSAYYELAEEAREHHQYAEAAQYYSAALLHADDPEPSQRASVLSGRGKALYRIQRFPEALQDLRAARAFAQTLGHCGQVADLLLDEATVLDWLEEWDASAVCAEQAATGTRDLGDSRLEVRCDLARGRMLFRREDWSRAAEVLTRMLELAVAPEDYESRVIGLLLLAAALCFLDVLDESERRFAEAVTLSESVGDDLHLGAAYCARMHLWLKRAEIERAFADLRSACARARLLGNAQLERFASFNLAQCLHWAGRDNHALPLASRARDLGLRFFADHPSPLDALLLARIQISLGQLQPAHESLEWIARHCSGESFPTHARVLYRLTRLLTEPSKLTVAAAAENWEAWQDLIDQAKTHCVLEDLMEVLWNAVSAAAQSGRRADAARWQEELRQRLPLSPLWNRILERPT